LISNVQESSFAVDAENYLHKGEVPHEVTFYTVPCRPFSIS